jgi:hypothetical protein
MTAAFARAQTITHMIDDVLSDALLHKAVQPGEIAFMELSRRSMQVVCTGVFLSTALVLVGGGLRSHSHCS